MSCVICFEEHQVISIGCGCTALYCTKCLLKIDKCGICRRQIFDDIKNTIIIIISTKSGIQGVQKIEFCGETDKRFIVKFNLEPISNYEKIKRFISYCNNKLLYYI